MQGELSQIIFENLTLLVLALFLTNSLLSEIAWGGLHAFRLSHRVHFLTATGLGSTFGNARDFLARSPKLFLILPRSQPHSLWEPRGSGVSQWSPHSSVPVICIGAFHVPLPAAWKASGDAGVISQFLVGEMWGQVHERASHVTEITRKQKNSGIQLAIFILFGLELEATALLFYFQLNFYGSTFRDLPRCVFPWQL